MTGGEQRSAGRDPGARPRRRPDRLYASRDQTRSALSRARGAAVNPGSPPRTATQPVAAGSPGPADQHVTAVDPGQLLTPAAAAQLLAVPASWLRRKAATRQVPCTFVGKHLRFSHADLAAIIAAGTRPAIRGRAGPHVRPRRS